VEEQARPSRQHIGDVRDAHRFPAEFAWGHHAHQTLLACARDRFLGKARRSVDGARVASGDADNDIYASRHILRGWTRKNREVDRSQRFSQDIVVANIERRHDHSRSLHSRKSPPIAATFRSLEWKPIW
jgi:hypothetical protein